LNPKQEAGRATAYARLAEQRKIIKENFTPGCRIEFHPTNPKRTLRVGKGYFLELKLINNYFWKVYYTIDGFKNGKKMDCVPSTFLEDNPVKIEE